MKEHKEPEGAPGGEPSSEHAASTQESPEEDAPEKTEKHPFRVRTLHTENDESGGH